jgi:nucleotide-binding universal stress UspA family protein
VQFSIERLLLAYHGTEGARIAEALAFRIAVPARTLVLHLYVVPEFWSGMQGDDWLNNAWTRDAFATHVEHELATEANEHISAVAAACAARGIKSESALRIGDPAECLVALAQERAADLVVVGPPRAKGVAGYRSRMNLETLVRKLRVPLLVAGRQ